MLEVNPAGPLTEPAEELARLLLENMPAWLEEQVRSQFLAIGEWGGTGASRDRFQAHFPRCRIVRIDPTRLDAESFDILAIPDGLQEVNSPWSLVRTLGFHAARHIVAIAPFSLDPRSAGYPWVFTDSTIATAIEPDFQLSSCKLIDGRRERSGFWVGFRMLLVYSRTAHVPATGARFDRGAADGPAVPHGNWADRQLSLLSAQMAHVLEAVGDGKEAARRQAEVSELTTALRGVEARAASLEERVAQCLETERRLCAERDRLQQEVAALRVLDAENQSLSSRAAANAYEITTLRRLVAELRGSLSWRITAPLRLLAKPLFRLREQPSPAVSAGTSATASVSEPAVETRPADLLELILPVLRQAAAIAVIPCAIPFSSALNQRPISCARYLADHGFTVLYVAWQWSPADQVPRAGEEVYPRVFHVPLYTFLHHVDAIASASHGKSFYLSTLPSPALVEAAGPLRAAGYHIHYDIMDDWEGFHTGGEAPWFSAPVEREMVVLADTVTAVSDRLAEKFAGLRSDIEVVRNGYTPSALSCEPFVSARSPLQAPKTVGYFGHLSDAWFDWDTVIYAAKKLPAVEFEIIGWGVSDATRLRLSEVANVRLAGLVPQNELHRYASKWWAGMIPFRPSDVSAAVDPLKIYEYLHLGLPSIVTGISGIARYPLVRYANDAAGFVAAIAAVEGRPDEDTLATVSTFLKTCVWDERFARLTALMQRPSGLQVVYAR